MKNKAIKMLALILIAVLAVTAFSQVAFAATLKDQSSTFDPKGFDEVEFDDGGASDSISRIIAAIINMVQIVGMGVAIIMLVVLAIKYISAAPGDKAEIKKHAVVYIVGSIVLFAATGILQIVKQFATNVGAGEEAED